jgi:Leucine-rich repeat (LRR) protein
MHFTTTGRTYLRLAAIVLLSVFIIALLVFIIYGLLPVSPQKQAIVRLTRSVPKARPVWDENGQLEGIIFIRTGVADRDLRGLGGLAIQRLTFIGESLTDKGLGCLLEIQNLSSLSLIAVPITDEEVRTISQLFQLEKLAIEATNITDSGASWLRTLKRLRYLNLSNTQVSGKGLEGFSGLTELEELDLGDTPLTDEGLLHISKIPRLKKLRLSATRITDRGLQHLCELSMLERLDIFDTAVTREAVSRLQRCMPSTDVFHTFTRKNGEKAIN